MSLLYLLQKIMPLPAAVKRCLRFEKYLMQFNKNPNRLFDINIAYGVAFFKNGTDVFLRDVLKLADSRMYKRKSK